MSSTDVTEAVTKLKNLSEESAHKVLSLIEDLAELEALEDAADLKDAREVLAEVKAANLASPTGAKAEFSNNSDDNLPATISYDQLRRELGLDR
jgi:hypothetical protein